MTYRGFNYTVSKRGSKFAARVGYLDGAFWMYARSKGALTRMVRGEIDAILRSVT